MAKTLQQHIDGAFKVTSRPRPEMLPDQEVLTRQRVFQDQASKLQHLRQQRVAHQQLVYEVVRHRGRWRILHLKKHSKPFDSQTEALDEAQRTARAQAKRGHAVEVILRRTDGQIVPHTPTDEP